MKRQTTILILFPVIIMLLLMQSCYRDDSEPRTIHGTVEDFYLNLLDNSGEYPAQPNENNYPKDALMLAIEIKIDAKSWDEITGKVSVDLRDPIKAIRIYTLNNLNDTYQAGTEITDLFKQYPLKLHSALDDTSVKGEDIAFLAFHDGYFYKALLTPPVPGEHQFKVEMEFKSGERISHDSPTFEIY